MKKNGTYLLELIVMLSAFNLFSQVQFTKHTIVNGPNVSYESSVMPVDLDNDMDMDLIYAANFEDEIVWFKNDGDENLSSFWILQQNTTILNW